MDDVILLEMMDLGQAIGPLRCRRGEVVPLDILERVIATRSTAPYVCSLEFDLISLLRLWDYLHLGDSVEAPRVAPLLSQHPEMNFQCMTGPQYPRLHL